MPLIEFTNIIIDDFSTARREPNRIYMHILTHIHTDHLKGLTNEWDFGPIYCSRITKKLLEHRFPSLRNIIVLELNEPTAMRMAEDLQVTITFFDANHCFGAVMVLIEGYMGKILYTGDIRFDRDIFEKYEQIYPPEIRNERFSDCSKPIDVLYLDNTFLKKNFDFPKREAAREIALDFVRHFIAEKGPETRLYIGLDNYGKEEIAEEIAKQFGVLIVVSETKYQILEAMQRDLSLFTKNPKEGFIEIIQKPKMKSFLEADQKSMGLILSGWVNHSKYKYKNRVFCVPYSLHSNFKEIHAFVNSIRPNYINPIVHSFPDMDKFYCSQKINSQQMQTHFTQQKNEYIKKSFYLQLQQLQKSYCKPIKGSFQLLAQDVNLQKLLMQKLTPKNMQPITFKSEMDMKTHRTVDRQRYSFNGERDENQIADVRKKIANARTKIFQKNFRYLLDRYEKGNQIEIYSDDSDCYQDVLANQKSQKKQKAVVVDLQNNFLTLQQQQAARKIEERRQKQQKMGKIKICKTQNQLNTFLTNLKSPQLLKQWQKILEKK